MLNKLYCDNFASFLAMYDDNAQSHSRVPPQGETSSKVKKRKTSKDEKDMEQVMVANTGLSLFG